MSMELLRAAKRVTIADANIRRAARRVGIDGPPFDEDSILLRRWHELRGADGLPIVLERFDLLLERAQGLALPGAFWKDLMRASEVLGLQERLAYCQDRFQQALPSASSRPPIPSS